MNVYTVRQPGQPDLETIAYNWVTDGGLVIFQDTIGRALRAVAITDGMVIDCAYEDDDLFEARSRLAAAQRTANLAAIEADIERLSKPVVGPNRQQRRQGGRH